MPYQKNAIPKKFHTRQIPYQTNYDTKISIPPSLLEQVPPVVVEEEAGVHRATGRQTPGHRVGAKRNDVEPAPQFLN